MSIPFNLHVTIMWIWNNTAETLKNGRCCNDTEVTLSFCNSTDKLLLKFAALNFIYAKQTLKAVHLFCVY